MFPGKPVKITDPATLAGFVQDQPGLYRAAKSSWPGFAPTMALPPTLHTLQAQLCHSSVEYVRDMAHGCKGDPGATWSLLKRDNHRAVYHHR